MDEIGVDRAVVVGLSLGARILLALAADHPDRVTGAVFVGAALEPPRTGRTRSSTRSRSSATPTRAGSAGTRTTGARTRPGSRSSSSARCSPSRTRPGRSRTRSAGPSRPTPRPWSRPSPRAAPSERSRRGRRPSGVRCPALVIHGDDDRIAPLADGRGLSEALGCPLDTVIGGGHCVQARHPVWFNLRLRRFVEQVTGLMRAREPDLVGDVDNGGVSIHYEVFGSGPTTVFLMPTFPIVDSRMWKAQVPYLARHFRVVTADPRGHGRSDRPQDPAAYDDDAYASDVLAVLDATGTESAFLVSECLGAKWALIAASAAPERVPRTGLDRDRPRGPGARRPRPSRSSTSLGGWTTTRAGPSTTASTWSPSRTRPRSTTTWWSGRSRPTQPRWALRFASPKRLTDESEVARAAEALDCPVLVMHGTLDDCQNPERGLQVRRADRRPPGRHRGRRPPADGAAPSARQHADQGVRRHAHRYRHRRGLPGSSPASASAGPCGSARRSAWATCCGTSPSPGPCASGCPTWRSSGWPSHR